MKSNGSDASLLLAIHSEEQAHRAALAVDVYLYIVADLEILPAQADSHCYEGHSFPEAIRL